MNYFWRKYYTNECREIKQKLGNGCVYTATSNDNAYNDRFDELFKGPKLMFCTYIELKLRDFSKN